MQLSRRHFLFGSLLSAVGCSSAAQTALGSVALGAPEQRGSDHLLVTVFLRGGADGLSLVTPHGDEDYYRSRPTLALAAPRDGRTSAQSRLLNLDSFFGLHPALSPLLPLYESGEMAVVHACGSGDQTRSHFEAMATVERGLARETGPASGWLARHLMSTPHKNQSPLRAVALGELIPDALRGAPNTAALRHVRDLQLQTPFAGRTAVTQQALAALYTQGERHDLLQTAGQETLQLLQKFNRMSGDSYAPRLGAIYPTDQLGQGLQQVACLIKGDIGLEAACLDHGSYDTHVTQGGSQGMLADLLKSLGTSLAAFAADLGPNRWKKTTVLVLSEFGRRVAENSGAGTDHGRGGVMFLLGGQGIAGGKVHGQWPGLAAAQLEGPGDLRVTTDYRNVLAEVLQNRLRNTATDQVFPGLVYQPVGVTHA